MRQSESKGAVYGQAQVNDIGIQILFRVRFVHYLLYFKILRITPIIYRVVLAGKQN